MGPYYTAAYYSEHWSQPFLQRRIVHDIESDIYLMEGEILLESLKILIT